MAALLLQAGEGPLDLGLGLGAADPVGALDGLAGLEVLVDLEEVLDLEPVELRDVVDVAQVLQARVVGRDARAPCRRRRPRRSSGTCRSRGSVIRQPGNVGSWQQHQRVERVAVLAEGVLDEAVVGRVLRRGEQRPVEADPAGLVVDLVLVALTLRDLDQ